MSPSATSAPSYSQRRIGTLQALHVPLGLPTSDLLALAKRANDLYRVAKSITKPDGSIRNTYDALASLKELRAKRRWGIFFKLAGLAYLVAILVLAVG